MGNIRIIGDLHFYDKDIIDMAPREFAFVEEMNKHIIESWNSVTAKDDTVIVNGDFIEFRYCTQRAGYDILDQLNGHIILIVGNHDLPYLDYYRQYNQENDNDWDRIEIFEYPILKDDFWIISHEPQFVSEAAPYANIFAHVHLNPMYKTISTRSFCTSAERLGYKPILLSDIKRLVAEHVEEKSMCLDIQN